MKKESFLEIILNKKISRTITSILIGTIFVVFGVLKAANISQFADYFLNFNISKIYYLASILVALEIAIGFCFLFQFYLKSVSMFTFVLVAFFSLIILYNYIFLGINDCGCGGGFLKMPIELSLLRNGIILIFTSYLSRVSVNAFDKIKFLIIFLFFSLSLGFSTHELFSTYKIPSISIGDEIIQVKSNSDKRDIKIFVFSPLCHHCQKEVASINKLIRENQEIQVMGMYDKVYTDKEIRQFKQDFKPSFILIPISSDSMYHLTRKYPFFLNLKGTQIKSVSNEL